MSNYNNNNQKQLTDSPCVRNCCLDDDDVCLGCFRHIDEITSWRAYSDEEKLSVVSLCKQRQEENQKGIK